jgi:hypothetical protein
MDSDLLFPNNYAESRERFRQNFTRVKRRWPGARLERLALPIPGEDLTLDWIEAPAGQSEKLLIFTLGEHGVEAFVGSGMLALFLDNYLDQLDAENISLLLVHAINAWGMQHGRRVNENNVDLNRSFVADLKELDPTFNPEYRQLATLLVPQAPAGGSAGFWLRLAGALASQGASVLRKATLLGQYHTPAGIYYGGNDPQPETQQMMELYHRWIPAYPRVLHLDMHTGYGPRWQMSVVASPLESRSSAEMAHDFGYPRVVKADPSEFYSIQGDMIDYVYGLAQREARDTHLFAASFEFGTYGDSLLATLRSLKTSVEENQLMHYGARKTSVRARIARNFVELFNPGDPAWREKALADASLAFEGILRGEGFIKSALS